MAAPVRSCILKSRPCLPRIWSHPFRTTSRLAAEVPAEDALLQAARTKTLPPAWFNPSKQMEDKVDGRKREQFLEPGNGSRLNSETDRPESSGKGNGDHRKVEDRTLGIGTSIRVLQKHLPSMLQSPPPSAILSPHISLHLFPSTHPDLPAVRGKMAYMAFLWTAPVAWGRIPGLNVKLEILSERMVGEEFVVRWQTTSAEEAPATPEEQKSKDGSPTDTILNILRKDRSEGSGFAGMFIFGFDDMGRVEKHTIEHADTGMNDEGKIIGVAEWLMRKAKRGSGLDEGGGGFVLGCTGKQR